MQKDFISPQGKVKAIELKKQIAKEEREQCNEYLKQIEYLRENAHPFKNFPKERELYYNNVKKIVERCSTKRAYFKNPYHSVEDLPEVMRRGFSAWAKKNNFEFK